MAPLMCERIEASRCVADAADRLRIECAGRVQKLAAELQSAFKPVLETPADIMALLDKLGGARIDGEPPCS
jgi:hypothetical protein